MKIQILGVGAVGSAQAYLASHMGYEVIGFDPGKPVSEHARMVKELEKDVDISIVCTPETITEQAIKALVQSNVKGVYVIKSTVPPGTTRSLMKKYGIHICHNPEFLVEKTAFQDILKPEVVIIGQCCAKHAAVMKEFYSPLGCPIIFTEPTVSETVKLTLNAYLSTLITFWNQVDDLTKALGISTEEVATLVKYNPRVSAYGTEFFGSPFGGKCLPKDMDQLIKSFRDAGVKSPVLEAIREYNRGLNANSV